MPCLDLDVSSCLFLRVEGVPIWVFVSGWSAHSNDDLRKRVGVDSVTSFSFLSLSFSAGGLPPMPGGSPDCALPCRGRLIKR